MVRRRIPDEIKLVEGTYRQDRSGDLAERVVAEGVATPGDLEGDALALWNELVPPLIELGIAKSIDSIQLQMMCSALAKHYFYEKIIAPREDYETIEFARLCARSNDARKVFIEISSRFGMNSGDRSGLRFPKEKTSVASRKRG